MAIKPILFNAEMVRAILDGRKTCTRRLVKFLPGENSQWTGYIKDGLTMYKADCDKYKLESLNFAGFGWHPSIHMPKEAARIWLKVADVRVERLQEITAESALAEGTDKYIHLNGKFDENAILTSFMGIWNSIIKNSDLDRYGWNANPWVWVIEFEQCEKPKEEN